ncbi:MAG: hypothetical protein ACRDRX_20000 [Pseudonocardiaceae bacterium]
MPPALAADLQAIGQRLEVSLFQVLLALFHVAVAAWAGVRDVVVGSATGEAHQELHLEKTVFDLGVPDLVNIKFSLGTIPTLDRLPELGGQLPRPLRLADTTTSRRHLALSLSRAGGGLTGGLTYRTDLLKTEKAAGLLEQFDQIMRHAAIELAGR